MFSFWIFLLSLEIHKVIFPNYIALQQIKVIKFSREVFGYLTLRTDKLNT